MILEIVKKIIHINYYILNCYLVPTIAIMKYKFLCSVLFLDSNLLLNSKAKFKLKYYEIF